MNSIFALMDTAATTTGSATQTNPFISFMTSYGGTILLVVAMIVIFYFFLYRPQKKQEKEAAEMKNSLSVGDEVTTIGGIIGEVVSIKDETCVIETTKGGTKIRILKSAISKVDVRAGDK